MVADSTEDLLEKLKEPIISHRAKGISRIIYCFTGQGAQWYAMGRELLSYTAFKQTILHAEMFLKSLGVEWSVMDELTASKKRSQLGLATYAQPLCTVLQIGLVNLLSEWGIQPTAVIGHSSGEIGKCS